MHLVLKTIADKYNLPVEAEEIIMKYIQKNLLHSGFKHLFSNDKVVKKISKFTNEKSREFTCFAMMMRVYYINPTKHTHISLFEYISKLDRLVRDNDFKDILYEIEHRELGCYKRYGIKTKLLNSWERRCGENIGLECHVTKDQIVKFIINNTENKNLLKKSYNKNQLINILLHENANYKVRRD